MKNIWIANEIFSIFAGPPKKCFPIKIVTAQRVPKNQISWMNAVEMLREDFQVSFAREFRIKKPILWMKFQYWLPDFFSAYVLTGSHMFCARLGSVKTCFLFSTIADLIQIYFRIRPFCCPGTEKAFTFYISSIFIDWKRFFAPRNRDVINFFSSSHWGSR